jgi:hypothetical protein
MRAPFGRERRTRRAGVPVAALVGIVVSGSMTAALATGAGATIKVIPNSNLVVGAGTYAATVSGPKGTFSPVPSGSAVPSARTVTAKVGTATILGPSGTFSAADVGSFVDDGPGGVIPDGVTVTALTPLVPVYPRQGIPTIKAVNLTGTTATLSLKAVGTGSGPVAVIPAQNPIVLVTQASGSVPFIADAVPGPGLCLGPFFLSGVCEYTAGNLADDATKQVVFANADGSFATPFTLVEGVLDGNLGAVPGPVYAKIFDPDGGGPAPTAPYGVPSSVPGAAPIGCAPGLVDRSIPNPAVGGVDYCMVSALALNAGVQITRVPTQLQTIPITWAARAEGFVAGGDLVIAGHDFANDDVIVKLVIANGKARQTANPLAKCTALNQTLTGVTASSTGGVLVVVPAFATGCTVPSTSITKITIIGSKDTQRSQIPPNPIIGVNAPKKAAALVLMAAPA